MKLLLVLEQANDLFEVIQILQRNVTIMHCQGEMEERLDTCRPVKICDRSKAIYGLVVGGKTGLRNNTEGNLKLESKELNHRMYYFQHGI